MIVISGMSINFAEIDTKQTYNFANGNYLTYKVNKEITSKFDHRFKKKRDKMVLNAISAADKLDDECKIQNLCMEKVGLILANTFGGWEYVENQLVSMYKYGLKEINPYVATAWFATATQGELSIKYGIKGYSKTICGGNIGGGLAIMHAADCIKEGIIKYAITGGTEAPNTKILINVLQKNALYDGAILFLMEEERTAKLDKRKIYVKIIDIALLDLKILNLNNRAISEDAIVYNNNNILDLDGKGIGLEDLFSLQIPYLLFLIQRKYKGKNQKILLNYEDKKELQKFSLYIQII